MTTTLQFLQHNDFITHCINKSTELDAQWARYIVLKNTAPSDLPGLLTTFNIELHDKVTINRLYNDTPHFKLNELFTMYHHQDDTVSNIFKALTDKAKSGDENDRLLAERFANDPIIQELKSKQKRIVVAIIDHHRNGVLLENKSYSYRGSVKLKLLNFQPKYRYEGIKFNKILSELASKKS